MMEDKYVFSVLSRFVWYFTKRAIAGETLLKEMMKMLDCTEKTLRKYRNDGYIGYSRVGDKFYYTAEDIYMFLKNSHIDSYQYS